MTALQALLSSCRTHALTTLPLVSMVLLMPHNALGSPFPSTSRYLLFCIQNCFVDFFVREAPPWQVYMLNTLT